jgi:hypothetical protein
MPGESEIEIRQVFEAEEFGEEFTPELREQEARLRVQMTKQAADKRRCAPRRQFPFLRGPVPS